METDGAEQSTEVKKTVDDTREQNENDSNKTNNYNAHKHNGPKAFAASAATKAEIEAAAQRAKDGSRPVITGKRPYRPKMASMYEEPEYLPDEDDTLEILYRSGGTAISKQRHELEPRDPASIIQFNPEKHQETLNKSIQWDDCPESLRPKISELIKQYWDVFAPEGLKNHIRGFVCHIDTGNAAPVCCKIPRYGPHEARVISELARGLEDNGLIEEARSPWGAQVVLAAKPNQEHVHWSEYIWRLTVSYRQLNAVTRPFVYPSRRCDDAARDIGPSKYFITMDFESGFWQVLLHPQSRDKTAFFVPGGQKRWTVMPMGCLNAHAMFCCLVDTMKKTWNKAATEKGIRDDIEVTLKGERPWTDAEVIVDDVMLHSVNQTSLIEYFEIVLNTLQHYQVTVKLKKCRFFPRSAEFVGMDVEADGNRPAKSKMQAINALKDQPPQTTEDLRKLIGLIGFYQDWINNYEMRISAWREHIRTLRNNDADGKPGELRHIWTEDDTKTMNELLDELTSRPVLARPDYTRRFYLKTDWCRLGMAAVLLQADPEDPIAMEAEREETQGKACSFDKHLHKLRLRPIAFASRRCSGNEGNQHSYTGEAATGVWAIEKYKRHLFGREFTWMTDCNGLRQFFEGDDIPTHAHQRMRQRLLRYMFTIVHRPAKFMVECDALTRYNRATEEWREQLENTPAKQPGTALWATTQPQYRSIAFANQYIKEDGPCNKPRTLLAAHTNNARNIWVLNAGVTTITEAIRRAGIENAGTLIEDRPQWRRHRNDEVEHDEPELLTTTQTIDLIEAQQIQHVEWIIAHDAGDEDSMDQTKHNEHLRRLVRAGRKIQLRTVIILTRKDSRQDNDDDTTLPFLEKTGFYTLKAQVKAHRYGSAIEGEFTMIVATKEKQTLETFHLQQSDAESLERYLDQQRDTMPEPDEETHIQDIRRVNSCTQASTTAHTTAMVQRKGILEQDWHMAWTPCFDIQGPGPDLRRRDLQWYESPFAIETQLTTDATTHCIRGIRLHELIRVYGYDEWSSSRLLHSTPEEAYEQIRVTPPHQLCQAIITGMIDAERRTIAPSQQTTYGDETEHEASPEMWNTLHSMLATELNQTTKIPLPSTASWQDSTQRDPDTARIITAITTKEIPAKQLFQEPGYHSELVNNRLELDDGILYRHETNPRQAIRHLRTRVVPRDLRQAVFSALHTAPMAGHTGYHKTFWKIAARYYWPGMSKDIREMTLSCAHCKAANMASHEAQQKLQTFDTDTPFDVVALDVWHPGRAASATSGAESHVIICMDVMTGFASATFVSAIDSETITKAVFSAFFLTHGLPRLTIIDAGNEFAGALHAMCNSMGLPFYTVSRGNHKAILCERFHRYLNKVQRIHAANCETHQEFILGTIFAVYAWNAAPVDGTNIVRSFAAMGREFPFPVDFEKEPITTRDHVNQGEQTIRHVEGAFPLFWKQRELLRIINEERREHHRELKNRGRNAKHYAPGDLVLVRKQVLTTNEHGPAKTRLKARGPYRIIEEIKPGTYRIQRLPGTEGQGRQGKVVKESGARLEKIPSPLIIHKPTNGIDTRLATYHHAIVDNPLEQVIGLFQHGRYVPANPTAPYAFERVEDIWQEDTQHSDDENDTSSDNDGAEDDSQYNTQYGERNNRAETTTAAEPINTEANTPINDKTHEVPATDTTTPTPDTTTMDLDGDNDTMPHDQAFMQHGPTMKITTRGRRIRPPERYRTRDTHTLLAQNTVETNRNDQTLRSPKHLYSNITKSRDKLFMIRHDPSNDGKYKWQIVQVQWEASDKTSARNEGEYQVRFLIRERTNSQTRPLRNCRYWPEIHERNGDGSLGPIRMIRPGKVAKLLAERPERYMAYEQPINLAKHAIVGPFDYATPKYYDHEADRIAFEEWEELIAKAPEYNTCIDNIHTTIPLR